MQRLWTLATAILLVGLAHAAIAGEDALRKTAGTVVSSSEQAVKLEADGQTLVFTVPKASHLAVLEASQLVPGDNVTITWAPDGDNKLVRKVDGRGTLIGTVSRLGENWIEVTPANGKPQRFVPRWVGGNPADGGGFDKEMVRLIREQKVGAKVALTWEMPEGKRVVGLKSVPAK